MLETAGRQMVSAKAQVEKESGTRMQARAGEKSNRESWLLYGDEYRKISMHGNEAEQTFLKGKMVESL